MNRTLGLKLGFVRNENQSGRMNEVESGKKIQRGSSFICRDLYLGAYMEKEKDI